MDRLFVSNLEDKEVLYKSARDRENVRGDPPKATKDEASQNESDDVLPV